MFSTTGESQLCFFSFFFWTQAQFLMHFERKGGNKAKDNRKLPPKIFPHIKLDYKWKRSAFLFVNKSKV